MAKYEGDTKNNYLPNIKCIAVERYSTIIVFIVRININFGSSDVRHVHPNREMDLWDCLKKSNFKNHLK